MANEIVTLNPDLAIANWTDEREAVLADSAAEWGFVKIESDEMLETVANIAKRAKKLVKQLSEKRLELTRPADEFKKKVCAAEKKEAKKLDDLIDATTKAMSAYVTMKNRLAEEERRRIEAEQAKMAEAEVERQRKATEANALFGIDASAAPLPSAPIPTFEPTLQKARASDASFTEVWTYQVTDANRVPRELCSPDPDKIKALLKVKKAEGYKYDEIVVEGITISTTVQVRSR